jgi:DNA-binding NarL/FixJ family response regulator
MSRKAVADRLVIKRRLEADSLDHIAEDLVLHITPWERAALEQLADGTPTGVLAERFGTSEVDLEARLSTLFARMGVLGRAEAVAAALRRGLVTRTSHTSAN